MATVMQGVVQTKRGQAKSRRKSTKSQEISPSGKGYFLKASHFFEQFMKLEGSTTTMNGH